MSGYCDLHCHLLYGVDDGAKTPEDSLEMGRALVDLGYTTVAPSPHARPEYATAEVASQRLDEVRALFEENQVALELHPNAENFFLEDSFMASPKARALGASKAFALVEAPYTSPLPPLPDIIFRMKLKGVTPLIAHPERCIEFERKGRAAELVDQGAYLQLDLAALTGRYGPAAKRLSRRFL
ncbi:MAG: tyrosine-protein phosphatase, partial [Myxococcaceae bacterium]